MPWINVVYFVTFPGDILKIMAAEKVEQIQLQVRSKMQISPSNHEVIGPPPDGGKAWLQVAVAR